MATKMAVSTHSVSTVKTVDDVFSQIDQELGEYASLEESREYVRKITTGNVKLQLEAIEELHSLPSFLSHISANTAALVSLMLKCGAMLGGPQATSLFYPICSPTDCPWDFFCHSSKGDRFVDGYSQMSNADKIEDIATDDGVRVVHFRKSINGEREPAKIRIHVSDRQPLACILDLKTTYEQTAISAVAGICFWPRLQKKGLYRRFESNNGGKQYPVGKTFYSSAIKEMKETTPRKKSQYPSIFVGIESRVEYQFFKNPPKSSGRREAASFKNEIENVRGMVYAIHNSSTKYLGTVGSME